MPKKGLCKSEQTAKMHFASNCMQGFKPVIEKHQVKELLFGFTSFPLLGLICPQTVNPDLIQRGYNCSCKNSTEMETMSSECSQQVIERPRALQHMHFQPTVNETSVSQEKALCGGCPSIQNRRLLGHIGSGVGLEVK